MKTKWVKAKFWIAIYSDGVGSTKSEVDGETCGHFGIHGHAYNYMITHLPTGYAISAVIPQGLKRTKKNLRILVDKLAQADFDWCLTNPEQIKLSKNLVLEIRDNCKFGEF